jgi:DNA replication and repair protein RecF
MNLVCTELISYNFRNLVQKKFDFNGKRIGFVGENGHGKTNILEAMHFALQGISWRTTSDAEIIAFGEREAFSEVVLDWSGMNLNLKCELVENYGKVKKRFVVNGVARTRRYLAAQTAVLLFAPDDLVVVGGAPVNRRSYLDRYLSSVDFEYAQNLSNYQKIVQSRNRVLENIREGKAKQLDLEYWTERMIYFGARIVKARMDFLYQIADDGEYGVTYKPNLELGNLLVAIGEICDIYSDLVKRNLHKEIISATSQYGPHKDDYEFRLKKKSIEAFGSRGQQRSVLLWFIREQVNYMFRIRKVQPILLLDDMFSELDSSHRDMMLGMFEEMQVFISGCEEHYFENKILLFDQVWRVKEGRAELL